MRARRSGCAGTREHSKCQQERAERPERDPAMASTHRRPHRPGAGRGPALACSGVRRGPRSPHLVGGEQGSAVLQPQGAGVCLCSDRVGTELSVLQRSIVDFALDLKNNSQ